LTATADRSVRDAADPQLEYDGRTSLANAVEVHQPIINGEEFTRGGVACQVTGFINCLINPPTGEYDQDQACNAEKEPLDDFQN